MSAATTQTALKSKVSHWTAPYVVVSNPGTLFERIEDHCISFASAVDFCRDYECQVDVMKVLPSGLLTTEF